MKCSRCGKEIPANKSKCIYCGHPVQADSGKQKPAAKNAYAKPQRNQYAKPKTAKQNVYKKPVMPKNRQAGFSYHTPPAAPPNPPAGQAKSNVGLIIGISVGGAVLLIGLIIALVFGLSGRSNDTSNEVLPTETQEDIVEFPDVDQFFRENSEIQSVISLSESQNIMTEKEVVEELNNRGFTDLTITTEYDLAGNYFEAKEVSADSNDKHPEYDAIYKAKNGDIWTITIIENQVTASPLSYNSELESEVTLMIAESTTLVSYDSNGSRLFYTIPHEDYMTIKVVDSINQELLEKMTVEELKKL